MRPMMTKGGRTGKHGRRSGSALSEELGINLVHSFAIASNAEVEIQVWVEPDLDLSFGSGSADRNCP